MFDTIIDFIGRYQKPVIAISLLLISIAITALVEMIKTASKRDVESVVKKAVEEALGSKKGGYRPYSSEQSGKPGKKFFMKEFLITIILAVLIALSAFCLNIASNVVSDQVISLFAGVFAPSGAGETKDNHEVAEDESVGLDKNSPTFDPTADVVGWGNAGEPRETYTLTKVNSSDFDNVINFNSIEDSVIGNEVNFVSARPDNGNKGADNTWYDTINAEDGETYIIRLYAHNNAKYGYEDVAEDVRLQFDVPDISSTSIAVHGVIYSSNALYAWYSDGMKFVSKDGRPFHLEYVNGSALYENNGIAAEGGVELSDEIVNEGVYIGYNALDGRIPGCYQYASYTTIEVKVVYD